MQLHLGNGTLLELNGTLLSTADNRSIHSQHWVCLSLIGINSPGIDAGYVLIEEFYHDTPDLCCLLPAPKISFHASLKEVRETLSNHDIVSRLFEPVNE